MNTKELAKELESWKAIHGFDPVRAVSLWRLMEKKRIQELKRVKSLAHLGMHIPFEPMLLELAIKRAEKVIEILNIDIPEPTASDARLIKIGPKSTKMRPVSAQPRKPIQTPSAVSPPRYPKITYEASREELNQIGFSSVQEFVVHVNQLLKAAKKFPVSEADYPNTKMKFTRLVARWKRELATENMA
jgi:hypothetical protein